MSVRNGFVLLIALSALTFLVACGGNGNGIINPTAPPTGGFSNSNLNGSYVFSVSGLDQGGFPYVAVGAFTANGSGGISGGSVDINDTAFTSGAIADAPLSGSSNYTIGLDGRGTANLTFQNSSNNPFTGSNSITLKFVLQDSFHGLVIEYDGNATGSGTLDQQTTGVTPTGTYAFLLTGNAYGTSPTPLALAGNFAIGSGGALTGLEDFNEGGANVYAGATLSGTFVAGPSSTPATTISNPLNNSLQTYDVYVIDASHMKIIETDAFATLSGDAYAQTTATLPTTATTLAFTLFGDNASGVEALGGFMVTDGNGNITSSSSEDFNTNPTVSTAAGSFTGTYAPAGTGRYTLGSFANFVGGSSYAAYPSSGGVLLLEIDAPGLIAGITSGAAYPQTPGAAFAASQGYGLNLTGVNLLSSAVEVDDVAEFTANSNGTITGVLNENWAPGGVISGDLAFTTNSSSFGTIDSNGRYGLSSPVANGNNSTQEGGFNLTFYAVDGIMFPFIEVDGSQPAVGMIIEQNASATSPSSVTGHGNMYVPRPMVVPHTLKEVRQK